MGSDLGAKIVQEEKYYKINKVDIEKCDCGMSTEGDWARSVFLSLSLSPPPQPPPPKSICKGDLKNHLTFLVFLTYMLSNDWDYSTKDRN